MVGREFTVKPQQTCTSSHFKAKSELLVPSEMMKKKKKTEAYALSKVETQDGNGWFLAK